MKTKSINKKIFTSLLAIVAAFSLTACTNQGNIDSAVTPLSEQITELDGYIDALESKVVTIETDLATLDSALETLEGGTDVIEETFAQTKTALETEIANIKGEIVSLKEKDVAFASELDSLDGRLETLETSVATLSASLTALEMQVEKNTEDITGLKTQVDALTARLNCMEEKHDLIEVESHDDGTHSGTCKHCEKSVMEDCVYGDWVDNEDGTKSKTCSTCNHTAIERVIVTIVLKEGVSLTKYWEDDLKIDLSTLLDITEGAGEVTYRLTTSNGSINGSILSCPLVSDYEIVVTTAETATHNAATFTFTISIKTNPATGGFDGEWITF